MRSLRAGLAGLAGLALFFPTAARAQPSHPLFVDRAPELGLEFTHFNGMSGELYFAEDMGSGAALFDYDGDGDLDVYLVQGSMLGDKELAAATFPPQPGMLPLADRLYRNDLIRGPDGALEPRFVEVTAASGIHSTGYGMGVATGDVDGDGWMDLYVTNFGPNRLLRNRGDGTFEDATATSGTDDDRWSIPATFFDFDNDGDPDLFVGNYVDFRLAIHNPCYTNAGRPLYCGPQSYTPLTDRLLRNRGDGTFEDVSSASGVGGMPGAGLGAIATDFNGDGWTDLYVANDQMPNFLWLNRGDGTFAEEALFAGCAVSGAGDAEASMGVTIGDFDGDGDEDLFMTHLSQETNTLYANDGTGLFRDATLTSGLGAPSWTYTSFGTAFFDYDNDGWPDLAMVNGAVKQIEELVAAGDPYPLHQPNQLFRNLGDGRFRDVTAAAGEAFTVSEVSRGAAFGDVDNDGDTDVLVTNNAGPARLLINQTGQDAGWLGVRPVRRPAGGGPGEAVGARAELESPAAPLRTQRSHTDGSYASAGDPRLLFGLGEGRRASRLRLAWPGGRTRVLVAPPIGVYLIVEEGDER